MNWEAYNEAMNSHYQAKVSHELIAAAASCEAKAWADRKARHGEAVHHARRNEIMAIAANDLFIQDCMIEAKGLDYVDCHRAWQHAEVMFAQPAYNSLAYGYTVPIYGYHPYGYAPALAYSNQGYSGYAMITRPMNTSTTTIVAVTTTTMTVLRQ